MMPMDAASGPVKPRKMAPKKVVKMPSCAAAPSSRLRGLASRGPKSVPAPMHRKISGG